MTANQINYFKAREEQRTNLANEVIERRKAEAAGKQAAAAASQAEAAIGTLSESIRTHKENEAINWFQRRAEAEERQRHNLMSETLTGYSNETSRRLQESTSNKLAAEVVALQKDSESRRIQAESSKVSALAAQMSASAAYRSSEAALQQAQVAAINAATRQAELEQTRAYQGAVVEEQQRSNKARETETQRSNLASEFIKRSETAAKQTQADAAVKSAEAAQTRADADKLRSYAAVGSTIIQGVQAGSDIFGKLGSSMSLNKFFAGRRLLG